MQKPEIELLSLFTKMIHEYEKKNEPLCFSFKKIEGDFFFTEMSQSLLKAIGLSTDELVGMNLYNHILPEEISHRLYKIYEEAWKGNKVFCYFVPPANKDVLLTCILKPIRSEGRVGRVVEVEGHCVPLNPTDFDEFKMLFVNVGPLYYMGDVEEFE